MTAPLSFVEVGLLVAINPLLVLLRLPSEAPGGGPVGPRRGVLGQFIFIEEGIKAAVIALGLTLGEVLARLLLKQQVLVAVVDLRPDRVDKLP